MKNQVSEYVQCIKYIVKICFVLRVSLQKKIYEQTHSLLNSICKLAEMPD